MTVSDVSYRLYCASPIDATMHVRRAMQTLENLGRPTNFAPYKVMQVRHVAVELVPDARFLQETWTTRPSPDLLRRTEPRVIPWRTSSLAHERALGIAFLSLIESSPRLLGCVKACITCCCRCPVAEIPATNNTQRM
jgi:hypothetical protein